MNQRRQGYSLIELIIVMSVGSVVLTVSAGWIHQSMKTASIMRDRGRQHQTFLRLSRDLRDHVHHGESIRMKDEKQFVIQSGERLRTYTISNDSIEMVYQNEASVIAQESFPLSRHSFAKWDSSEMPNWITLIVYRKAAHERAIEPNKSNHDIRPAELHVRAAVDRRDKLGLVSSPARQDTTE